MRSPVISDPDSFHEEARYQRLCAVCGSAKPWHAHHVIPRQWLKRNGLPEWDTRNALRVCVDCHMSFEHAGPGRVIIYGRHLVDQNVCYIFEVMGEAGQHFMDRHYHRAEERFQHHFMEGGCALCL